MREDVQNKLHELASVVSTEDAEIAMKWCRDLVREMSCADRVLKLSIVAPVYNERETIAEFHSRLIGILQQVGWSYEILYVDDGSEQETATLLRDLADAHVEVKIVRLSRNFGHQHAINTGMNLAVGEMVIIMDSDLQDPPELIPDFLGMLDKGYDVVYGTRRTRKDHWIKKVCYSTFYRTLKFLSSIDIPLDAGDFCVMRRPVVESIKALPERNRFIRGLRAWVGYRQVGVPYDRDKRYGGKPKYTIRRLVHLALDGLISFSYRPLRAISALGFVVSFASFSLALFYIVQRVNFGLNPPGFASTIVAIFFFSGVQLVTLGILGEYLGKVYEEVKRRPLGIVQSIYSGKS